MKKTLIGCAAVMTVIGGIWYFSHREMTVREVPNLSSRSGQGSVSSEFLNAQKSVDYYRNEIATHPDIVKNYIELAQVFLQEARVTAKHHEYLPKTEWLLDEALRRDPENYDANISKASMLMTMHQFTGAKEIAERMVAHNPHSAAGFGVLCDAQVELGEYENAVQTCDRMLAVRPDTRSYARASYLRELHGDEQGAIGAMKLAADAGVSGQENRAWALYNLGKLFFNEGKLDTAAFIFNGILDERPEYAYALSGLAQVKKAKGLHREAIDLLTKASQITPEHLFLEQLADVYRSLGEIENANGVAAIALKAFEQHEQGGWNINREYAMFCADNAMNLGTALERVKKEYSLRPENIDVLETYAWVLYKNGKAAEAMPYVEHAMKLHTKNFMLYHHASMIYAAAGMQEKADEYRRQATVQNPYVEKLSAGSSLTADTHSHETRSVQFVNDNTMK